MPRKRKTNPHSHDRARSDSRDAEVRIIGGEFRGRRLQYYEDPGVRPMKHRTREAIFNLVSTECDGHHAIDLFAGSGALGLEALSRGAASATFIEKHVPTARLVEANIRTLAVDDRATLLVTSAFLWAKRDLPAVGRTIRSVGGEQTDKSVRPTTEGTDRIARPSLVLPWLVFCSPPYAFYREREAEMLELIGRVQQHAAAGSILIVEADESFDFDLLRQREGGGESVGEPGSWDVRPYPPAIVGVWRG